MLINGDEVVYEKMLQICKILGVKISKDKLQKTNCYCVGVNILLDDISVFLGGQSA